MSGSLMLTLLNSCSSTKITTANISGSNMIVPLKDFEIAKGGQKEFKKYIVVQNEKLQYPICVYRLDENNYQALWMRCTHQGTELQVFGDKLQCPAHGSEFTNTGTVQNGPAADPLRNFPVTISETMLKVSLQ